MSDDWTPAFPGQRPPFAPGNEWRAEPGNERAVTHGAFSVRRVEPLAKQIAHDLRATDGLEYLTAPMFTARLMAYARAQAKAELVQQWLDAMTPDEQFAATRGKDSPAELLRQLGGRAARLGDLIGLSPVGLVEIADDIRKARTTLARRAERARLSNDLKDALREQSDQIGNDL
jgi:hypothetical protein